MFSAEDGHMLALSTQEYALESPHDGWAEVDAEIYWRAVVAGIRDIRSRTPGWRAASIGLSSQGQTFILLDKVHRPIRPAVVWLDLRAQKEVDELLQTLGPEAWRSHTGYPFCQPIYSAPKLIWLTRQEPEHWRHTHHIAMLPEFIGHRLTGQFICDPVEMGSSGFYDDLGWWEEALKAAGIPKELFGNVKNSGERIGMLTASAARDLSLEPDLPVGVGSMDQLAGAVGAGNVRPGLMSGMVGTAMAIIGTLPGDAPPRGKLPADRHAVPGLRYALTFSMTSGILLKWCRDRFAPGKSYEELMAMASSVEIGSGGLTLLPHFAGMATPTFDSSVRGGLVGLTLSHGQAHMVRAVLEAVGFMVRDSAELLRANFHRDWRTLRILGGATRSPAWVQMISDITGMPIELPHCSEAAVLGGAIFGGVAAEVLPGIVEASERFYAPDRVFSPGPDAGRYHEPYRRYRMAMERMYPGALGLSGGDNDGN
jgi:xylulokinase